MKILLLGSGGREHALAWKIAQSEKCEKLYIAPGNAGTSIDPDPEDVKGFAAFMERYRNKKYEPGDFIDKDGNVLGKHKGYVHYTIGQRRGLGIAAAHPLYVVDIRPETNTVVLGKNEDLFEKELTANRINLISVPRIEGAMRVKAKIRYRHKETFATVTQIDDDTIKVIFDQPQRAITKGQAVVLYDGDIVVGGGTII